MSGLDIRDGTFDVVIAQAPNVATWPTVGARAIATLCSEMGLSVGVFGGDTVQVRGVVPAESTGGWVLAQDAQARIHRFKARAIVKIVNDGQFPDPFPGWRSPGLIPLSSAHALYRAARVQWSPAVVVLGTGNKALRFASELIEDGMLGAGEVFCVESHPIWGAKRFAGWEVERRRFEILGGKILEAEPVSLTPKGPMLYELRLKDPQGVRVLECARVVAAGPYRETFPVREYPPGSLLFEFEQTAEGDPEQDVDGWILEDQRARFLAGKLIRALVPDLGARKEDLDAVIKQSRSRLKRYVRHREKPFTPAYQGKWIASTDMREMRASTALPKGAQQSREIASVECFEEIACDLCARACPTQAITLGKIPRDGLQILQEDRCTACGICLTVCPSRSIVMLQEAPNRSTATLVLPWRVGPRAATRFHEWKAGEFAQLVNRRGEPLGNGRVIETIALAEDGSAADAPASEDGRDSADPARGVLLVRLEVPSHLAWEARGLRPPRARAVDDPVYLASLGVSTDPKVEVSFNGEKRLVREGISVAMALFELGHARAQDSLLCVDGSCQLCHVWVDGVKKLACQTQIHRGVAIKSEAPEGAPAPSAEASAALCPCLGIGASEVVERIQKGGLTTPDAVSQATHVGSGRCHGQLCGEAFRRLLIQQGMDASRWVDWRFPWADWVLQARSRSPLKTARS